MNRTGFAIVLGALVCFGAAAQSQTSAQARAQSGGQASEEAGKTQAQASGNASASMSASAQNGQANSSLASGTAFNATLSAPVDSKKCKPGDSVTARTTESVKSEGKTMIPKGAKLIGHVTQASARANGESQSALGIMFDKAILKNGEEIPLSVGIQALASAQSSAAMAGADMDTMGGMGASAAGSGVASGRGALGGATSTAGGAVGTVTNTAANVGGNAGAVVSSTATARGNIAGASKGAVGGLNAAGELASNSHGVFGLNGLNLNAAASNATEGSVITSAGKNVHLDDGTRMLLVSQAQAGSPGESKQPAASKPEPKTEPKPRASQPNDQ
jgi:trimeric autotransporter adhesin